MNLYERYVDWAAEKIATHIYVPIMNSQKTTRVAEKLVELNGKVARKTGYDYLEHSRKSEEYDREHPKKAALKKIGRAVASALLFGGISDYRNLHD